MRLLQLQWTWALAALLQTAGSASRQVMLDDLDPRIVYSADSWASGQDCPGCVAQPIPAQTYGNSWRDSTFSGANQAAPFFTLAFNGTGIEIRCIFAEIIRTDATFTTGTNVTVTIDGSPTSIRRDPRNLNSYAYNSVLFQQQNLTNREHNLRVELLRPSLLLFDSLTITEEDDAPSSSTGTASPSSTDTGDEGKKKPNIIGPVIGAVLGVVAVVAGILFFLLWRRRQKQNKNPGVQTDLMAGKEEGSRFAPYHSPAGAVPYAFPAPPTNGASSTRPTAASTDPRPNSSYTGSVYPASTAPSTFYTGSVSPYTMDATAAASASAISSARKYQPHAPPAPSQPLAYQPPLGDRKSPRGPPTSFVPPPSTSSPPPGSGTEAGAGVGADLDRRTSSRTIPPPYTPGFSWVKTPMPSASGATTAPPLVPSLPPTLPSPTENDSILPYRS